MQAVKEDNTVRITHFINPHCFWYKLETTFLCNHEQRKFLDEFNVYCELHLRIPQSWRVWYIPQVGDLVAQHNIGLARWIRCEVEGILEDLSGEIWFQLWAIDEGFPIKSIKNHIRPIPKAYASQPRHAQRGALKNILPCDTMYDYEVGRNILTACATWGPGIVSTMQTILEDAVKVSLVEHICFQMKNEVVHFVDIFLKTHDEKSFNIVDLLRQACSDQLIISPDEQFFKAVFTIKTLNMVRYKNNDGIDKLSFETGTVSLNKISQSKIPNKKTALVAETDLSVQHKVKGDWFSRNKSVIAAIQKNTAAETIMVPTLQLVTEIDSGMSLEERAGNRTLGQTSYDEADEYESSLKNISRSETSTAQPQENQKSVPNETHNAFVETDYQKRLAKTAEINMSLMFRQMKPGQVRRQELGVQKKSSTYNSIPVIAPAGCSLVYLLNKNQKR